MKKIVFATNNSHKLTEVRAIVGQQIEILSLADINCFADIPETADTLEGNALLKARFVYDHYGLDCFADDTGLEVEALGGAPGVRSARYDDITDHDSEANMRKLLRELGDNNNRKAQFRTVIALIEDGAVRYFEGIVEGSIATEKIGTDGFGYDPVFIPEEAGQTFAQLGPAAKNEISHRARAVRALVDYLTAQAEGVL